MPQLQDSSGSFDLSFGQGAIGDLNQILYGSQTIQRPRELKNLEDISLDLYQGIARPALQTGADVIDELLRTGGVGALQPFIGRAIESARSAQSQTQQQFGNELARAGVTGSQRTQQLGNVLSQGNLQISQIPLQVLLPLLQQVLGTLTQGVAGSASTAVSGQGTAAQIAGGLSAEAFRQQQANNRNTLNLLSSIAVGFGT